ncbi:hypothetical protein U9M48_012032, partial [Paspalum notatum var. saurae]
AIIGLRRRSRTVVSILLLGHLLDPTDCFGIDNPPTINGGTIWLLRRRSSLVSVFISVLLLLLFIRSLLLELVDQAPQASIHATVGSLGHYQALGDVGRRDLHRLEKLSDGVEQRVRVHAEVVHGQRLEGLEAAVGHLDVHVHPAAPDQRRVQLVDEVGGEDDDPLAAVRRPEAVDEVEQAGQRHGARRPLALIGGGGHDGWQAGGGGVVVGGSTRAGEVEGAVDVLDDDDGLAGGLDEELAEVVVAVHHEPPAAVAEHGVAAAAADVGQVVVDDEVPVALAEGEAEAVVAGAAAVAAAGLHGRPPHGDAAELVGHLLALAEAEHEAVALGGALGLQLPRVPAARRAQLLDQYLKARRRLAGAQALGGHEALGDVGGREPRLSQDLLHGAEQLVRVDGDVVAGERPERLGPAVGHLDVHVHAPAPDQRRVQLLGVVGGEHDDALAAAGRPEAVDEVEQAGERDRVARRRSRVGVRAGEAAARVPGAVAGEVERAVDVLDDDDGLAGGLDEEAAEVAVGVHHQPAAAVAGEDLAALAADVGQVLVDDDPAVAQVEGEPLEPAPPLARSPSPLQQVVHHHRGPPERDAAEVVGDVLAVAHADDEPVAFLGALGEELARVLRARAAQVRLHLLVGGVVVGDGAVAGVAHVAAGLRDVDGHVGVHEVEEAAGAAPEEEVEVGLEQPARRVGGQQRRQRRQDEPQRAEVGEHRAQVRQHPPPPLGHHQLAAGLRLRHGSGGYGCLRWFLTNATRDRGGLAGEVVAPAEVNTILFRCI